MGLPGAQGLQGPAGPSGTSGYANFTCPSGQSVTGFNAASQPVCGATSGGGGGGGTQDADGDGIPDALDPCPAVPNVTFNGTSYCPGTIYDIATGLLNPGYALELSNVQVVCVSATEITIEIMPGDSAYTGPDHSSIIVQLGSVPPPGLGNRVNAYGVVTQGQGFSLAALEVLSTVTPPPTLSTITPEFTTVQVGSQVTLTVNMTAPVTADTLVNFDTPEPGAVLVSPSVVIPASQSSATFTVTGVAPASSVTIEALFNGAEVTSHLQVVGP